VGGKVGFISIGGSRGRPIEVTEIRRERIKSALEKSGLTQSELAREIGCTPGAVNQILSGRTVRSRFLPEIAIVLGVSVSWLLGEADAPNPPEWPALPRPMTIDEHRLVTIYRRLPKKDQAALKRLIERMAGEGAGGSAGGD
jgi:transcriptional regulator with XRE-family HTH domain